MIAEVFQDFQFEAAHCLPDAPEGHVCARLHGHSFRVRVLVKGEIDPCTGWVIDFNRIADAFEPLRQVLDHSYLNEIEGLSRPTSETIAVWIWRRMVLTIKGNYLIEVTVRESSTSGCTYRGE